MIKKIAVLLILAILKVHGQVGINTTDPKSDLEINGSIGLPHKTITTSPYTVLSTDAVLYFTAATTQVIHLPAASTATNRIYWLVNSASVSKTISAYTSISGTISTELKANSSIALQSNGTSWLQFVNTTQAENAGITYVKELSSDQTIVNWQSPWTLLPLTDLDITVPAGKWLDAEYVLRASTANAAWVPSGFRNRGFASGDFLSGLITIPAYNPPATVAGGSYWTFLLNETNFDTNPDPAFSRQVDASIFPINNAIITIKIRYKNNSTSDKVFGYDFGADLRVALTSVNLTIRQGSSVVYTIF